MASTRHQAVPLSVAPRRSLLSRPLDCFYFLFFAFHILNFIFIDGQSFYPKSLIPTSLAQVKSDYLRDSGDPFVKAFDQGDTRYSWFAISVYGSLLFQNPVFVAGVWMLWNDDGRIYPILASYGLLASTTTMQCLASVLYGVERQSLSSDNVGFLVKAYTPFVVIPLIMLFDMTVRSVSLIGCSIEEDKRQAGKRA